MAESVTAASNLVGTPSAVDMVRQVRGLVERNRQRWRALMLVEGVASFLAVPLAYLLLVFAADNVMHLPTWGRVAAQLLLLALIGLQGWRLMRRWRQLSLSEDEVALAIERRTPGGLQNQLINSVQLGRDSERVPDDMRHAVVAENYHLLARAALPPSARSGPASAWLVGAVLLLAAAGTYFGLQPQRFMNAAGRIFMPLANIEPIYSTTLKVQPGDVTVGFGQDVAVTIDVAGVVPASVRILRNDGQEQKTIDVPVDARSRTARYTFEAVRGSMTYEVRGGDFATRPYLIKVPMPWQLQRAVAVYKFPAYTELPDRQGVATTGDLEALAGTEAEVTFELNQPADEAVMLLEPAGTEPIALTKTGDATFTGSFTFAGVTGYRIQARTGEAEPVQTPGYTIRAVADQSPTLILTGLRHQAQVMIDAVEPLEISARDDYGLTDLGLFYRHTVKGAGEESWQPIERWPLERGAAEFKNAMPLAFGLFDAVEGDTLEVALRARDNDPLKGERWTTGTVYELVISSPGATLQLLYERILKTEAQMRAMIDSQRGQSEAAATWIDKFKAPSELRWDDQANLDALTTAMAEQAAAEAALQDETLNIAKNMVKEAGSLSMSVDMLATSEMRRAIQILESVPKQENPQSMRAALSDARMTHERVIESLEEMLGAYVTFRKEWELTHMVPFTRMLADRQQAMAEASVKYADMSADAVGPVQRSATTRRQAKLLELCGMAHTAFAGMAEMESDAGPVMVAAFTKASESLAAPALVEPMRQAEQSLRTSSWSAAAGHQREAATQLAEIYAGLRQAQSQAAQEALDELKELAKSDLKAQEALDKLKEGSGKSVLDVDADAQAAKELVHMRKTAAQLKNKNKQDLGGTPYEMKYTEEMIEGLSRRIPGPPQNIAGLKLATTPGGQISAPHASDLPANRVNPMIQSEFEDLVGELLDEADAMQEDYQTFNLNTAVALNESGEIQTTGGDLNSTAAAAATGNMKPPTNNVGGASRMGRQGARSFGLAVGSELINRKGRDEVQEGQLEAPDQGGLMKEIMSEDPQKDSAVGIGGKKIDDPQTSFNTKNTDGWRDDMVDRLGDPQQRNQVVERKGAPLDPRVAERMYTMRNKQEQLVQRIKALRKELNNLYLPTDHLDEVMRQLQANMDRLTEKPDADIFRMQVEQLDKLKSTVMVFSRPTSQFGQGLQREQAVKGRVLDEPAAPPLPGYEEAVSRYYAKLSGAE